MVEQCEKSIKIGFKKKPAIIFDEIEIVCSRMIADGWALKETCIEDGLGYIHLFFERQGTLSK
jgi:hypothetical protein